jgi:pimeloyl-ACP methyl ester carboxylesterase
MSKVTFVREQYTIGGVETVVYTAGKGEPLVYFHGAGTVDGFDFAEAWTDRFRVIVPYHPGFGESGDDPALAEPHDYIMHYLELFEALELQTFNLVGISFGGYLAAKFASEHGHRIRKLVLIAPACMPDEKHPMVDILAIPGETLVPMLVSDFEVLKKRLPTNPTMDFIGDRYREATTFARLMWEHPLDFRLTRYLHRLKMPTLLVWGAEDRIVPVQQLETWKKHIPEAQSRIFKGGHLVQLESPEAVEAIAKFLG